MIALEGAARVAVIIGLCWIVVSIPIALICAAIARWAGVTPPEAPSIDLTDQDDEIRRPTSISSR